MLSTNGPTAAEINESYLNFKAAAGHAVFHAISCGQMLLEKSSAMNQSHRGTGSNFDPNKPDSENFNLFLREKCPEISRTTAYRWMDISFRILSYLELTGEGEIPLSKLLQEPDSAQRNALDTYLANKPTMREALAGVVVEGDDASRLTRAQNGAAHGGFNGEDRKDFPLFVGKHLLAINANLEKWDQFRTERPAQFQEIAANFRAVICGGKIKSNAQGDTREVAGWPRSACELMADILRERLRMRDGSAQQ